MRRLVPVLVALLVSTGARANPDVTRAPSVDLEQQARDLLDLGVEAFKRGELDKARVALMRVIELVPEKPNPYRWLGLTEARLDHCEQALRAFDTFLQRVPITDPRTIEVVTLRDRCRSELAPKVGTLTLVSTPAEADVRVRGVFIGKTPLDAVTLEAGSQGVTLHKNGFVDQTQIVEIPDGGAVHIDVVLGVIAPAAPREKKKKRYWIIGAVLGPLAAVGLGVGLGIGLTRSDKRTLPPLMGQ